MADAEAVFQFGEVADGHVLRFGAVASLVVAGRFPELGVELVVVVCAVGLAVTLYFRPGVLAGHDMDHHVIVVVQLQLEGLLAVMQRILVQVVGREGLHDLGGSVDAVPVVGVLAFVSGRNIEVRGVVFADHVEELHHILAVEFRENDRNGKRLFSASQLNFVHAVMKIDQGFVAAVVPGRVALFARSFVLDGDRRVGGAFALQ